jgi:hypothetical protein
VIRICLTHGEASMDDLLELAEALTDACHGAATLSAATA